MALLLIALLIAFAVATGVVLADSGLRLWSALGGLERELAMRSGRELPAWRSQPLASVTTRVSYSRQAVPVSAPWRAAA